MRGGARPPVGRRPAAPLGLWRNLRVRRVVLQLGFLALVVALLLYLSSNLLANLRRLRIGTSFEFLGDAAGFAIADSNFQPSESLLAAILVGVKNTALVSLLGIVLATMLGLIVGVARLSTNWLVRRAAAGFVETLRNVPVLVVILFWWLAVMLQLPPIERAVEWGGLVLSSRGVAIPWIERTGDLTVFLAAVGAGAVVAGATAAWRTRRWSRTGLPHHRVLWAGGILLAAALVGFIAGGSPLGLSLPERGELATQRGLRLSPEYAALLLGLTVYTASHIAEIVRGSILAVPKGQTEAANALGLSGFQRLRYVVLPQALRIIIPPLANQYLSLTKNSSLGIAIAYPEVTRVVGIAVGQQAPAPQTIAILMLVYLCFSLGTSLVANLVNRRLALRGR
jgi:general L-amino acid transport system permease protein